VVPKALAPPLVPLPVLDGNRVVLAAVVGLLLGRVGMALVGRVGLCAIKTERVGSARAIGRIQIGIVLEQRRARQKIVDVPLGVLGGLEKRLTFGVQGIRIAAEIMIERLVFVEDDHEVLDWIFGLQRVRIDGGVLVGLVGFVNLVRLLIIVLTSDNRAHRSRGNSKQRYRR
jgi:hypothetical protein